MLSIERQQKIKEALYLFLLNRREENALSQAMADNNARVIDSAESTSFPISPNRNRILLLGVLIGSPAGCIFPGLALYGHARPWTQGHRRGGQRTLSRRDSSR